MSTFFHQFFLFSNLTLIYWEKYRFDVFKCYNVTFVTSSLSFLCGSSKRHVDYAARLECYSFHNEAVLFQLSSYYAQLALSQAGSDKGPSDLLGRVPNPLEPFSGYLQSQVGPVGPRGPPGNNNIIISLTSCPIIFLIHDRNDPFL